MWRIVAADNPLVTDVNGHLLMVKGKMVRPTLLLLAANVDGKAEPRATTLAAVAELIHLATLVHDDAVDHSVMRRGRLSHARPTSEWTPESVLPAAIDAEAVA